MRVAALYDIHGNLPALEAVLEEVHREGVDRVVIGGDVLPGPMPHAVLAVLGRLSMPAHFIFGNGETDVLATRAGETVERVPEPVRELLGWTADHLSDAEAGFIEAWPATLRFDVPGLGNTLFCHATPDSDATIFTAETPEPELARLFASSEAETVVCGHTHMQFDRRIGDVRVVNAGSVGMPFGEPGAYWALLGPGVDLRRTGYDLAAAAERIRASDYPQSEEFAEGSVLHPPSEREMLALFTGR